MDQSGQQGQQPGVADAGGAPSMGVNPEVEAYVGLVRQSLSDLPPEEIEELTGGLEADLAELAAESEEPLLARLGEPSVYAAELRAAAGFPPAVAAPALSEPWWQRRQSAWRARWDKARDAYPWLEQARPIWWVIRGAMLAWFLWLLLGANLGVFFIVIGAALSFWVGLRQDGWTGWRGRGVLIANVAAALLLLPGMLAMAENRGYAGGAFVDGQPAENFYVYDGQGQRVEGARIFTNTGAPLTSEFSNWWDGDDVLPDARFDAFPVTFGPYDGWQGTTEDAGERFGTQPFTPPVAMPPAFPIETESTETPTTTPESTQSPTEPSPTEPSPTETPTDEPAAEEPTDTPTDATPEQTETATPQNGR